MATLQADSNGAVVGYEAELWRMADTLRGNMDAAEYKHVVLGLIFLKYISDAFEEARARLEANRQETGADPDDPDEYRADNIFWVPAEARWQQLQAQARQPTIGQTVDTAMVAIERDNPSLKDVLPKPESTDGRREGQASWDEGAYQGESLGSMGTDVTRQRVFSSRTGLRERSGNAGNRGIVTLDAAGYARGAGGREFGGVGSVADSAVRTGAAGRAIGPGRG